MVSILISYFTFLNIHICSNIYIKNIEAFLNIPYSSLMFKSNSQEIVQRVGILEQLLTDIFYYIYITLNGYLDFFQRNFEDSL